MDKSEIVQLGELLGVTSNKIMEELVLVKGRTTSILASSQKVDKRLDNIESDIDALKVEIGVIKALAQTVLSKV